MAPYIIICNVQCKHVCEPNQVFELIGSKNVFFFFVCVCLFDFAFSYILVVCMDMIINMVSTLMLSAMAEYD